MAVVGFDDALEMVLAHARRLGSPASERVRLLDAVGRVLAEGIRADRDQPPFARATRDGYAVRAGELSAGMVLRVVGQVRAGESWGGAAMGSGEALQIMTGAPLPGGADAVAMVEFVERVGDGVRGIAGRGLAAGENVVPRGSEAAAGDRVLGAGTRVGAAEVALAAACGCAEVAVFARPSVGVVATGDELVELEEPMEEYQIRNSNSYALAAMVGLAGGRAERLGVARDVLGEVRERVMEGRKRDLLILSGGVSMGEYDLVEEVLAEAGAEFFFTGVKMQPGKPVVFGRLPERDGLAARVLLRVAGESDLDAGDVSLLCRAAAAGDGRRGGGRAGVCAGYAGGGCCGQGWVDAAAAGAGGAGSGAAGGAGGGVAGIGGCGGQCAGQLLCGVAAPGG